MSDLHGKTIVELEMGGGELVWVTPPSFMVVNALRADLAAQYPEVDRNDYLEPLEGAMVAGELFMPPDKQAAYEAAKAERELALNKALSRAVIEIAVDHPDGRDNVLARYKSDIDQLRLRLNVEGSDWYVALNYFIVATLTDFNNVMSVVNRDLPLTEPEVAHGLRMFRRPVRQQPVGQAADDAHGASEPEMASDLSG